MFTWTLFDRLILLPILGTLHCMYCLASVRIMNSQDFEYKLYYFKCFVDVYCPSLLVCLPSHVQIFQINAGVISVEHNYETMT